MKQFNFLVLSVLICLVSYSCKSKKSIIDAGGGDGINYTNNDMEKVEFANNFRSVIGINYKLDKAGIQDTFNTLIDEYLAGDIEFSDYGLNVTVSKADDAKLEFEGKKVLVTLSLDIGLEKETFLTDIHANGVLDMIFSSDIEIDSTWDLITQSELQEYKWIKEPKLTLGAMSIPVESLANNVIEKSKAEIAKNIDMGIKEQFNLRNRMLDLMKYVEKPYQLDTANMYATFEPEEVFMSRTWNSERWTEGQIGVKANTYMSQTKPEVIGGIDLPNFAWNEQIDSVSSFNIQLQLDYQQIQDILEQNLVNKTFSADGQDITIHRIELNGYQDKIEVVSDVTGSFNGTLVFRGRPVFNNDTQTVEVADLDIKVKTKNILHKAGSWLFKSKIKNSIQERMKFSVKDNIELAQENIDNYLGAINEKGEVELKLKLKDTNIQDLLITKEQVYLALEMQMRIDAIIYDFFSFQRMGGNLPPLKN